VAGNGLSRFCELHQNRQNKSGGLSGPGLGDADDIVSRENEWNGRNLNWSRLGVTRIPNGLQNLRGKMKCAKRHEAATVARYVPSRIYSSFKSRVPAAFYVVSLLLHLLLAVAWLQL
jgi:hypothetical protein